MHSNFCFFGVFRHNFVYLLAYILVIFQIGGVCMTQKDIKLKIIEQAEEMAKEIARGKHVEVHHANGTIKIYAVDKKIVR